MQVSILQFSLICVILEVMVGSAQRLARTKISTPPVDQRDFYSWLRRLPIGFLHEIYKKTSKQNTPIPSVLSESPISEFTSQQVNPPVETKILLRKSVFVLIFALVGIEILFDLIYLAFRIPFLYFQIPQVSQMDFAALSFLVFVVLNFIKIGFMIHAALKWLTFFYEIRTGEVRHIFGIINRNEKIYLSSYAQEVIYTQDILGRICNFGTIEILNPTIKEKIYLDSIPNPKKYVEIIKNTLPAPEQVGYIPIKM